MSIKTKEEIYAMLDTRRIARLRDLGQPAPVGFIYKKNPDGTRCKNCRPVPVYGRAANELVKTATSSSTTNT